MTQPLDWLSKCKNAENHTSTLKHYDSRCKRYRVTTTKSKYGLPDRSYSLVLNQKGIYELIKMRAHYGHEESCFQDCEDHNKKATQ